jgi:hypothetical protein
MKLHFLTYTFFIALFSIGFASCVSKKKYVQAQKRIAEKDSVILSERTRMNLLNDSLVFSIASRDSLIDSLSSRLNETISKKEKEKNRVISSKKSTMSKEQEYEKKSLFIYNFTKLVEWPIEYNGTEFVIAVAGNDEAIKRLQDFMGQKKVSGKKIIVVKYKKGARYNVVYVTSSEMSSFSMIKNAVKKNKTLIISDDASQGSHISFMLDQDKVRYVVDKPGIEKAGLKVGQELMRYSG